MVKPEDLKFVCGHCDADANYTDSKVKAFKCGTTQYIHQGEWNEDRGDMCKMREWTTVIENSIEKSTKLIERMNSECNTSLSDEVEHMVSNILVENKALICRIKNKRNQNG